MAIVVSAYSGGGWVDISDYVDDSDKIPYFIRNLDYTIVSEPIKMKLSYAIGDVSVMPAISMRIKVVIGGVYVFGGIIKKVNFDYDDYCYECEIENNLYKLQNYLVDYANLYNLLYDATGVYFNESDANGYSDVYLLYLLEKMFSCCDLTLTTTTIGASVCFTTAIFGGSVNVTYADFYLWFYQLLCINQDVATQYANINDLSKDYAKNKITFRKFVSFVCQAFGFILVQTDEDTWDLQLYDELYTVSNDTKYNYKSDSVLKKYSDVSLDWLYIQDHSKYVSAVEYDLRSNNFAYQTGHYNENKLDWYNNFVVYYDDRATPDGAYTAYPLYPMAMKNVYTGILTEKISFTNPDTITRADGSFSTDGFVAGRRITISSTSGVNDGIYFLATVNALTMTITDQTKELTSETIYEVQDCSIQQWGVVTTVDPLNPVDEDQINIAYNKSISLISDYTKETIVTDITTTVKSALSNYIDIENQTSEIIQVVF